MDRSTVTVTVTENCGVLLVGTLQISSSDLFVFGGFTKTLEAWSAGFSGRFPSSDPRLDFSVGTFRCTFCQAEVEEDESAMPKKDARTLLARFNEQIEPIYALLRETEDVNLAYEILEPEPTEIPALKQR